MIVRVEIEATSTTEACESGRPDSRRALRRRRFGFNSDEPAAAWTRSGRLVRD